MPHEYRNLNEENIIIQPITHHFVSPKHLQTYVNEFAFRYNRRKDITPLFSSLVSKAWMPC